MIAIDSSELASDSRLPDIPDAQISSVLESLTGADILVSPLSMPALTETLIKYHVKNGAVLINRKSFFDMLSSIASGSINMILARMLAAGARHTWQRVIMSTGIFVPDLDTGKALVGESKKSKTGDTYVHFHQTPTGLPEYKSFATIRRRIALRGGYYLPLTCDEEIPRELAAWEKDLKELSKTKEVWPHAAKMYDPPDKDDPLQEPVEVRDWRRILARFDGIGPVRATALRDAMLEAGAARTLFQALCWASWKRRDGLPKIQHWGKGTFGSVRDTLGVPDGFDITLEVTK